MTDLLTNIKTRITELEADLAADPRSIELRELRRLEAFYEGRPLTTDDASAITATVRSAVAGNGQAAPPRPRRSREEIGQIVAFVEEYIRTDDGGPVPITELAYEVKKRGHLIGEADPNTVLSRILTQSRKFVNRGRSKGWELIGESPAETPSTASASDELQFDEGASAGATDD